MAEDSTLTNDDLFQAIFTASVKAGEATTVTGRGSALVKYWKKPGPEWGGDGWITIGPHIRTDQHGYRELIEVRHFKELPDRYGVEVAGRGTIMGTDSTKQFEVFVRNGGLTAIDERGEFGAPGEYIMPAEQIIAYGWHRNPAIRKARPDVDIEEFECPYGCLNKGTRKPELFSSEYLLNRHLQNDSAHKAMMSQKAMADSITQALRETRLSSGDAVTPEFIASIVAETVKAALGSKMQAAPAPAVPGPAFAPSPAQATRPRYPDGHPDRSWQRQEMLAWGKDNGFKWTLDMTREDILDAITEAELASEPV